MDDTPSFEDKEVSRAALVERTIVLTEPGTLQAKVEAAMGDEDVSTLQKLTLSGPFTGVDVQYWKTALTNLVEFDLTNAVPTYVEEKNTYINEDGNEVWLNENSVGEEMFSYMTKLERISFPACATRVGWKACKGCSALVGVVYSEKLLNIDSEAFMDCVALKTFTLPKKLTYLSSGIFRGCTSLASIVWPENLTEINWGCFNGCALISIEIPSSVIIMDNQVFANNHQLKSVKFNAKTGKIPDGTFENCYNLEDIEIASDIVVIEEWAFGGCKKLNDFSCFNNIKEIGGYAFYGCAFESLDLSKVEVLEGNGIFNNCKNLKSVIMPKTLKSLGDDIFGNCTLLTEIDLPEGLESIGSYAFAWTSIKDFIIPSTVKYIGAEAFQDTPITMLTIPASVTTVGGSLVDGCRSLKALIWNSSAEVRDINLYDNNYPRPYLYLSNDNTPIGPNWKNVIINGEAESITLCEGGQRDDYRRTFGVPIAFKAKKITFERYTDEWIWTYPGKASGWQTIVLPFTPTKIEHESKGVIAPFNSGIEGAKPFWLRELTSEGFKDVTTMKPNVPYIMALPNSGDYLEEYRLYGRIIFSAENVELRATPDVLEASAGPDYSLQPTYDYVQAGPQIYALNVNYGIDGYESGGVFARSSIDVYAFEAYVVPNGRSARSVFEMGTRSSATRTPYTPNKTGIPQIGDM